ncbi:MAG: VOC family protein [Pseudomonadales bacterium]
MSTVSVAGLGYLEIGVSNLAAWRNYAENVLGAQALDAGDALHLRYDAEVWRIRLLETGEDDVRVAGFYLANAEDLALLCARLEGQGVSVTSATTAECDARGVTQLARCQDPFGLAVELYVGDRTASSPFVSPIGVEGFVTGAQGLGHVVLAVGNEASAYAFYIEGLGFRLSDNIYLGPPGRQIRLTFLHCNPRHHTIALAPVPSRKRLNHIMLQLQSMDDVGVGLDRARAAGVEISSSLGRHSNDHMFSFYMQTPSGFDIEYGHGGIEIDDATWTPQTHHAPSLWGHKGRLN